MESESSQIPSDGERRMSYHVDCYDEDELAVDKLASSIDLCAKRVDTIVEQSVADLASSEDVAEPYIGMEFNSKDDAREFYISYGRRTGFTVRVHHNRRSRINNLVIGQDFVCSKEGFREKKYMYRKDRVLPPPPLTREGCPAMLRVALKDGVKWVVTKSVKEHNHALMCPGKVPLRGSARSLINEDEKDQRIRQLTMELNNERQKCKRRCAAYQEQLHALLNYVEEHTDHLSKRVQDVIKNIREHENEQSEDGCRG